jgi:FkbM family methyltransferase
MMPAYEAMLEQVYRSILKPGDLAFDVGAHTGRHSLPISRAVGPTGRVVGFEPLPFAFKTLSETAAAEGATNLTLHNVALGENEGEATFTVVPEFPEYSGFKERKYHSDQIQTTQIKVQVRRLDSFRPENGRVRYIKVDAEGGELTILRSGRELIARDQPIVTFELGNASLVNYPYDAGDYFDYFADLQYRMFSIYGLPLNREQFVAMAERQFFWDYVALPAKEAWFFDHEQVHVLVEQLASAAEHVRARQAAEARLSELQNSRSWRITEPLRLAKDRLARLRGR